MVTHSHIDPLARFRKFLNSVLVRPLPSAIFNGIDEAAFLAEKSKQKVHPLGIS
jgi:hypothetical protein